MNIRISSWRGAAAALALVTGGTFLGSTTAEATPGFARQTGMACVACHFQHYPTLNAFGRAFKASGYTMRGAQPMVEGDDLSMPVDLNMTLVTKLRYQKSNGEGLDSNGDEVPTNYGEIQWPDEAAILIGGRVGENIGFLLEHATFGEANVGGDADEDGTIQAGELGDGAFSLFNSFKVHFNLRDMGATRLSTVLFSTDAGGAPYGFEMLNTGAQRFMRPIEDRNTMSAAQYLGMGDGEATGLAVVLSNPGWFVNYSAWAPAFGNIQAPKLASYLRAAITPNLGGWDTGFGVQYYAGEYGARVDGEGVMAKTEGWVIDAQAQGEWRGMPLGLYASYGSVPYKENNFLSTVLDDNVTRDKKALGLMAELGVIPNKANVYLAYRTADNGRATKHQDNAVTLGGSWMVYQNVKLELFHTAKSGSKYSPKPAGGDAITTLMIFAGF